MNFCPVLGILIAFLSTTTVAPGMRPQRAARVQVAIVFFRQPMDAQSL